MLKDEITQIFHCLQTSLTRASSSKISFLGLTSITNLSQFYQVLICGTHVHPQLCQFWTQFWGKLDLQRSYHKASIRSLRLRLSKLQKEDQKAQKVKKQGLKEGWEEIEEILHWEGLPYILKIVKTEFISRYYNNVLADHFTIKKT